MKRFLRYTGLVLLALVLLPLLAVALLYLSPVREGLLRHVLDQVSASSGLVLRIGESRLDFPLDLELRGVFAGRSETDTLSAVDRLALKVDFSRVLDSRIGLKGLRLEKVRLDLPEDSTGFALRLAVDSLVLDSAGMGWKDRRVMLGTLEIGGAGMDLSGGKGDGKEEAGEDLPLPDWKFGWEAVRLRKSDFRMKEDGRPWLRAGAGLAALSGGRLDLAERLVDLAAAELSGTWCELSVAGEDGTEEPESGPEPEPGRDSTDGTRPWTVRADRLTLADGAFSLKQAGEEVSTLLVSGIVLEVDSIYNRSSVVKARLARLEAVESRGTEVLAMQAGVELDTASAGLRGVSLRTPYSRIGLEAAMEAPIASLGSQALGVKLAGTLGLRDLRPFVPGLPAALLDRELEVDTELSYTDSLLDLRHLGLLMPGALAVHAGGRLEGWNSLERMKGAVEMTASLEDASALEGLLPEGGLTLPSGLGLKLSFRAGAGRLETSSIVKAPGGSLDLEASCLLAGEEYRAVADFSHFPLDRFLQVDSLGSLTAVLALEGRGLDPETLRAGLELEVKDLLYRSYRYRDLTLTAGLDRSVLQGLLKAADPSAGLELAFWGDTLGKSYRAGLSGRIGNLDLYRLAFMGEPFALSGFLETEACLDEGLNGSLRFRLDSLGIAERGRKQELGGLALEAENAPGGGSLNLSAGDLRLEFQADTSLSAFASLAGQAAGAAARQFGMKDINMEELEKILPPFRLELAGGRKNAVHSLLRMQDVGFRTLDFRAGLKKRGGLRLGLSACAPYYGAVRLDSLQLGCWQAGKMLMYALDAKSTHESWKGLFNIAVNGRLEGERLRVEFRQKDLEGRTGFDLGLNTVLRDSSVAVSLFPVNPVIGYRDWSVNRDNRLEYHYSGRVAADLRMESGGKHISLGSQPDSLESKDRFLLEMGNLDLETLTRMFPFVPSMAGRLDTDLELCTRGRETLASGRVEVEDLAYDGQPVGKLGLDLHYAAGGGFTRHKVGVGLDLDEVRRVAVTGGFSTAPDDRSLDVAVDVPGLPLSVCGAFLSPDLLRLEGMLRGKVSCGGTLDRPLLDGSLALTGAAAKVVMLGTSFRLDSTWLKLDDGRLRLDRYCLEAPDGSRMTADGTVSLNPAGPMGADLRIKADTFGLVNVRKKENSQVYGRAYADLDTRISGPFSALVMDGNVKLLNRSDISYVLMSTETETRDGGEDMVRFIPFRDTLETGTEKKELEMGSDGFTLRMQLEIDDQVKMGVDLSPDGTDRVNIQGGGNLLLSMEPEAGMALSGKYILTGGDVEYNVPIVGKKVFRIRNGSFVEWTGNLASPELNITASEQVKAQVEDGDNSRQVVFEAIIRIRNRLEHPDITFDMAAPNDMVIQNELNTFPAEERTRLALNLLIYNTYTSAGSSQNDPGANMANNAIYSFVENELNRYTRKAGLTVGLDSRSSDDNSMHTDVTYQFSRQLFNDRVRVKIGGRISTDGDEGQGGSVEDNLVDDISIEYVLTSKRNLYIKVFRHSNYESVLDGEVTQTGGGIVWRKNFRKFRELFHGRKRERRKQPKQESADETFIKGEK